MMVVVGYSDICVLLHVGDDIAIFDEEVVGSSVVDIYWSPTIGVNDDDVFTATPAPVEEEEQSSSKSTLLPK